MCQLVYQYFVYFHLSKMVEKSEPVFDGGRNIFYIISQYFVAGDNTLPRRTATGVCYHLQQNVRYPWVGYYACKNNSAGRLK